MKRSTEDPGTGGREKAFRRQNPVSCQFCRSKKLKCDRAIPCSNCVARNVECVSATGGNPALFDSAGVVDRTKAQPVNHQASRHENVESRLKRLEEAVFKRHYGIGTFGEPNGDPKALENDATLSTTSDWLESVSGGGVKSGMPVRNVIDNTTNLSLTNQTQAISPGSLFHDQSVISSTPLNCSEIVSILPGQAAAEVLCNHYIENVSWVYHIIHAPTIKSQLNGIYDSLNASEIPKLSHVALIATILGVGAYFKSGLALGLSTREEIKASCKRWVTLAQRALTDVKHASSPTIETMQATIIMSQYLPNFARTEMHASFIGNLIASAHILGLHQVDSHRNRKLREKTGYNVLDLEIKRRIWWHIVSTDWILCFMSGPQCGTYIVHQTQMNVDYPSNCDDATMTSNGCNNHPIDVPTQMSYSIAKILMSTAIREVVDEANSQGLEVDEVDYDTILSFDRKFQDLSRNLPWFFKLDDANRRRAEPIDKERPYIRWQRNMAHFGYNTRLSRLHRPYLVRGFKDPTYAYSRMVCLRSARMVIEMEKNLQEVAGGFNPDSGRLWIITHHVFVATVTLVMDYCCNRDNLQAAERKAEIMKCYQILERSQEESTVARNGLAHLKQVMRDWKAKAVIEGPTLNEQDVQALETGEYPTPEAKISMNETAGLEQIQKPLERVVEGFTMTEFEGMDLMPDLWLDPYDFSFSDNPQWELLFRDLEQGPPMLG